MCQLNVYCVPKTLEKQKVLNLMKELMGFEVAECIDDEQILDDLKEQYSFYISGGMRCNCDSLPCKFQDQPQLTYSECWKKIIDDQFEKFNTLKEFMERKEYESEKKAFDKLYKKYSKEMNSAFDSVRKFEQEKSCEIMENKNLSDQEKSKLMGEEVYPKVNELMQEVEKDERVKRYYAFLEENRVMWETYALTKKREKKKKVKALSVDGEESVELDFPSLCIYDLIDNLSKTTGEKDGLKEYADIRSFVEGILNEVPQMKIICYWQDGEWLKVESEKKVKLNEFTIETLCHLKYCELLTIEK